MTDHVTIVRCPRCGATDAEAIEHIVEITRMRCAACGHTELCDEQQIKDEWNVWHEQPGELPAFVAPLAKETRKATFGHGSRRRLSPRDLPRFPSESLFDRVARAVCRADCLPRKELYESWEVARRVRRRARGGRVVEMASGHALLAHLMLLLDDTSPSALAIDPRTPASASKLAAELVAAWPRLAGRVTVEARTLAEVAIEAGDVVVSAHACGALTDDVLAAAIAAGARVAVLPCCHEVGRSSLAGWLDGALAVDVARAQRLEAAGYAVHTQTIDPAITPKNRLLLGLRADPRAGSSAILARG